MSGLPDVLQPIALVLLLLPFWGGLCLVLARLSGWHALARHYAKETGFSGRRFSFQSAQFRGWFGYNNCFTAGADPVGLHLSVWRIFRLGHPPLLIPWQEVSVSLGRRWWVRVAALRFARSPAIPVLITQSLAEKLAAHSATQFHLPRVASGS